MIIYDYIGFSDFWKCNNNFINRQKRKPITKNSYIFVMGKGFEMFTFINEILLCGRAHFTRYS